MYRERMERGVAPPSRFLNTTAQERSRRQRWEAKGRAKVTHPDHGSVVVPHSSNFSAILNAAEVWGCDWLEIHDAEVWAADPSEPVARMPYII
ncbi:MAG: hypothetical protein RR350_06120 [Oscillibacter sp.]